MKKVLLILAAAGLASAGRSAVLFSSLVKDGNTGHDGTSTILYGNPDDDWMLVSRPSAPNLLQHAVVSPASGWLSDSSDYRWIGAAAVRGMPAEDLPGDYVYRLQIALPGSFDPNTEYAEIQGRFASDNVGYLFLGSYNLGPGYTGHLLNNSGATPSTSGGWTSFTLTPTIADLSGSAGNYSLDLFFVVNNAGSANSNVGLLVEFTGAQIQSIPAPVVPEPATLALGAGALAAALARRRKR